MSKWNHLLCVACWNETRPESPADGRTSDDMNEPAEPCCRCGKPTGSGIYIRQNPVALRCVGIGPVHEAEDA